MLGLSVIILFNLIYNVNSNLAESSANCSVNKPVSLEIVHSVTRFCFLLAPGNSTHIFAFYRRTSYMTQSIRTRLTTQLVTLCSTIATTSTPA